MWAVGVKKIIFLDYLPSGGLLIIHIILLLILFLFLLGHEAFKVGEELIPPEWIKNKQSYFGIIMPDNSMDPEFHKNDCLIIREDNKRGKDGLYCVLEKDNDYATIRKLININDGIMVMPLNLNGEFKPKTYLKGTLEFESLRILGPVVQVKRYYD